MNQFYIQVSEFEEFPDKKTYNYDLIAEKQYELPDKLKPLTKYYWRIKGYKNDAETEWSETANFTTKKSIGPDGLEDVFGSSEVSVYPVPAENVLNLNVIPSFTGKAEIKLINTLGEVVHNMNVDYVNNQQKKIQFQLEGLNPGVYFIRVETENGIGTRKVSIK